MTTEKDKPVDEALMPLIAAKRIYHMTTAEAWVVYDAAVNPARLVRDEALAAGKDKNEVWKKFNEDTLPARITFETMIKPSRLKRDKKVEEHRLMDEKKALDESRIRSR